jgi:hypothetical protein
MSCKESKADQKQKEVCKQNPFMLEMRKETGQSRAGDEPGTQQLLQDDSAQAAESDGERMPVKNGHAGEREGEK